MKRTYLSLLAFAILCSPCRAQRDWRFGFEDTWSAIPAFLTAEQNELVLTRLRSAVRSQPAGGDINFPALLSGWTGMQPVEGGPINFKPNDDAVRLLQDYGFSMLWNLRINAKWSSVANPDCHGNGDCAPDSAHEDDLYAFIRTMVERYDGDGYNDMGYETPGDTTDDLRIPVRFYLMTGEIEFAGAYPEPEPGYGDSAANHFWNDSIDNLLRTHRIVYRALHDADPSGRTKLIGSGGVLFDLYSDFPDYPRIEGPTVQARLRGNNNHAATYVQSFERLKRMLRSYGNDSDGIECDYVGWHPHMPWREVDQAFSLIRTYAGDKPIYIDDMWCNIFTADRTDSPGSTLFTGGGASIEGDFPNERIPSYSALLAGMVLNQVAVVNWYYARHARTIVKAFAAVFGEGAERASISGTLDFALVRLSGIGFINLMGTPAENFFLKPGYHTYRLLVDKLHDFTRATELQVSDNPRTRVYMFERAQRGPVYVCWSETGAVPPGLDYSIATGEEITLNTTGGASMLTVTHIVSDTVNTEPTVSTLPVSGGKITMRLGYEPVFIEGDLLTAVEPPEFPEVRETSLLLPYPQPFDAVIHIPWQVQGTGMVKISVLNAVGRSIAELVEGSHRSGNHEIIWNGCDALGHRVSPGMYFIRLVSGGMNHTRAVVKFR